MIYNCVSATDINTSGLAEETVGIKVFPNPTSGFIQIESTEKITRIRFLNSLGEIVYQSESEVNKINFSQLQLQEGIYFLEVFSGQKKQVTKIVLQ